MIALLIDFDNVILGIDDPGFDVELVVNALRERGQIVLGRCYGDWYRHNRHRRKLMEQGLELVETPAFGPVIKNSADIRIALDGYEIGMTQHHIDTFCIVSGDSDFLPLIKKLQSLGKKVLVICGSRFTSDMVRRNCNEFISYENLLAASVGATEDATTLDGAFVLLHRAMAALRERGSDIRTSTLKQMMLQLNPVFSERSFGCSQFRGFLDKAVAADIVKLGPRDKVSGELHVLLPEEDESNIIAVTETKTELKTREEIRAPREETRSRDRERTSERAERTSERLPDRLARRAGRRAEAESVLASMAQESAALAEARIENPPKSIPAEVPTVETAQAEVAATEETPTNFGEHMLTRTELLSRGLRRGRLKFSGKTGRPEALPVETPTEITSEAAAQVAADALTTPATPDAQAANTAEARSEVVAALDNEPPASEQPSIVLIDVLSAPDDALGEAAATTPTPQEEVLEAQAPTDEKPKRTRQRRRSSKKVDAVTEATEAASVEANPVEAGPDAVVRDLAATLPPVTETTDAATANPEMVTPLEEAPADTVPTAEAAPEASTEAKKPARRRRAPRKKADAAEPATGGEAPAATPDAS